MNSNINTSSNYYVPISVEPTAEARPIRSDASTNNSVPARLINSTNDLRRAELSGEQYNISEEQLVRAIEQAIKKVEGRTTNLQFSVHEQTKRISVKVTDRATGEVIREIPPEKTLDFVAKLWEMAGILVDEKR
ncbi:flagellar protein FlaG [Paenibacillus antri]|uniref:flagellar protein FlaG n=1 Tax=Paenibacillus antri TaxID=2582848 RepID=UPI001EE3D1B7|nr:flagellar protein FlaG [Paenibacillus antri]